MKREEFTKTSLHNHFGGVGADYKIDSTGGHSFDINYAKQMIDRAEEKDYQLLAMTNSNHLWISEYNMLTNYINNICINNWSNKKFINNAFNINNFSNINISIYIRNYK